MARRAFLLVLDSFGIGSGRDAASFGDEGSDTYGHIRAACARGDGDRAGLRHGPLALPNLDRLGLAASHAIAAGKAPQPAGLTGFFGSAHEISKGKDTPSGHWEIASFPVPFDWTYFPDEDPAFPAELLAAIYAAAGLSGSLGNCHASGTEIIARLGEAHLRSSMPIFYTSSDSVFQIAAHEGAFGLERLYDLCRTVFALTEPMKIGRVIARPFEGDAQTGFRRTANRRDFAIAPPGATLLDRLVAAGHGVHAVGKIGDIFAHRGLTTLTKAAGNDAMFDAALGVMARAEPGSLTFVNLVDFDMLYGHRRDVPGYAAALEAFDRRLPEALSRLEPGDLLMLTADHGCDPTWQGSDHTREQVPVLGTGPGFRPVSIGQRGSFADMGETVAAHLGLAPAGPGRSFLAAIGGAAP